MSVYEGDNPVWLRQALESVFAQTIKPDEVICVVDGPIPNAIKKVLEDYCAKKGNVNILHFLVNRGRGAALRDALQDCKNDIIALMDADDICLPYRFKNQLDYFEKHPDIAVLGGWIQEVDSETLQPLAMRKVPLTDAEIRKYLKTRMPFNNQTVMFKKSAIMDSGNFQPFDLLEDYYMWMRVIAKGYKTANLEDVLVNMRVNPAMYGRRGGLKYFCKNKLLFDEMRKLGLLNLKDYYFTLFVRFIVQVLMPSSLRGYFYRKVLR